MILQSKVFLVQTYRKTNLNKSTKGSYICIYEEVKKYEDFVFALERSTWGHI